MRKKEKAVPEQSAIESIIHHSLVCRLGLTDGDTPYVIPLNFGYRENALYFHTGHKGKKIEILKKIKRSVSSLISIMKSPPLRIHADGG